MMRVRPLLFGCRSPIFSDATKTASSAASSTRFSSTKTLATPAVCLSADGTTFLAYHPQRDFPYEHSRPLPPKIDAEAEFQDSPFKVQIAKAFKEKSTSNKLTRKDLEQMFGECKSYFRPQPQERKRRDVAEYYKKLKDKTLNELPED